jgi:hypothetical protein
MQECLLESPGHAPATGAHLFGSPVAKFQRQAALCRNAPLMEDRRPPRQDFALNLSAKRRLCNTVGKRFIDGTARCCAVSTARSRAAATTSLARSNQSLVLRGPRWPGAKSCTPVNVFMICPQWSMASPPRPNYAPDHGHLMAIKPNHPARDPDGGRSSARKLSQKASSRAMTAAR